MAAAGPGSRLAISAKEQHRRDDESRRGVLRISFPVQLVVLVVLLIVAWSLLELIGEAVFVLVTATLVALVLNPAVRALQRLHIPRVLATFVVVIGVILAFAGLVVILLLPLVDQLTDLRQNLPALIAGLDERLQDLRRLLERLRIDVNVDATIDRAVGAIGVPSTSTITGIGTSVARSLALAVAVVVTAIYMLADNERIRRFVLRHFPTGSQQDGVAYIEVAQSAVVRYVKAQLLVSLAVGTLTGVTLYVLGLVGIFPLGARYALVFGVLAGVLELIPFIGPVLAAIPPILVAFVSDPLSAVWVLLAFVAIQQIEGNVLSPLLMGNTLRVHPVVVIFATLVGAELRGVVGIIIAIALIPLVRETIVFFRDRIELEGPWLARRERITKATGPAGKDGDESVESAAPGEPAGGPIADRDDEAA